ncbi:MAG: 50S ribosomal protein L27 [Patescibacteria group bacterium]|nr:50S ribosomal protein L27 [Patescibacteria group bacterium]
MAHKKAGSSTALGRDSIAKRLGVKLFAGERAKPGSIIIRQRGTAFRAGKNVKRGKDDTLYAVKAGRVKFTWRKIPGFTGKLKWVKFVEVE